ncbi:MAG: DUF3048 domain-containing protein [Patescibacteria group bacterium]|nr:DUF3048 domain-containing protein [Patescibacteria group bacterium]
MINKKIGWLVIFLVFFASAIVSYSFFSREEGGLISPLSTYKIPLLNSRITGIPDEKKELVNEPKTETCPLNGALFSKSEKEQWEKRRPLGVMIENHKEARPQSGLSAADVVYEAVAEGGITRFLAVFYCQNAPYIGPIRSARIYFIDLLREYADYPLYAHVGGANTPGPADALGEIRRLGWSGYNDLNQFSVPFPYFWRDYERLPGRATEHTVYSSTTKLWQYAKDKRQLINVNEEGKKWDENFTPWLFKDEGEEKGEIERISFGFWNSFANDYSVDWVFDEKINSFKRFNADRPHLDKNTNKQLIAKNVVIVFAQESPVNDGYEGGHILYQLIGSGKGLIFQEGKAIEVSWQKRDEESRMRFFDKIGKEVEFIRGPIWIEILPIGNKVEY